MQKNYASLEKSRSHFVVKPKQPNDNNVNVINIFFRLRFFLKMLANMILISVSFSIQNRSFHSKKFSYVHSLFRFNTLNQKIFIITLFFRQFVFRERCFEDSFRFWANKKF